VAAAWLVECNAERLGGATRRVTQGDEGKGENRTQSPATLRQERARDTLLRHTRHSHPLYQH
jgi:hypothetical protein